MSHKKDARLISYGLRMGLSILGIFNYVFLSLKILFIFANSVDPDGMPHSVALHCVLLYLL